MFEPLSGADGARIVPASGNLGVAGKQFWLDPDSRELATRPHPIHSAPPRRPGSAAPDPAGHHPRPSRAPVRIQRRVASNGVIMVTGQRIPLGRTHAGQVVTIHASDATLTIDLGDGTTTIRRTTTHPARGIKAHRPRNAGYVS